VAVDDLWFLSKRGPDGARLPAKRHGQGKRYRVRWIDDKGKQCTKFFDRKVDAETHDANKRADLSRGEYVDAAGGRTPFSVYAEQWRLNQVHRPSTRAQVETHMRRHVLPYFGDRPLSTIRPTDVQSWVRKISDELAPATVEVVYRYGSAVFKAAVADRLIVRTPCVNVKLPRIERGPIDPLPVPLVGYLADAMPDRYRSLIDVGAATGLRQGEAFGLEVDRVDFLRRTVRVDQQLITLPGEPPFIAPPKTSSSRRVVPIGKFAVGVIAAHLAQYPAREVEVVDKSGPRPVTRIARLIFTTDRGKPINRPKFGNVMRPAVVRALDALVRAAGTDPTALADATATAGRFKGASFHDLRHFYASLLIAHGASVREVQARLGHATATETLNTYAHLWPDSDDRTRDAVDLVLGDDAAPGLSIAS
jgi:integrase